LKEIHFPRCIRPATEAKLADRMDYQNVADFEHPTRRDQSASDVDAAQMHEGSHGRFQR
jgi:hypothetical protein